MNKKNPPNFNKITRRNLMNDAEVVLLYCQAVRAGFWPNQSSKDVLDFLVLVEKALEEDKEGTAGKLFYWLVKNKETSKISDRQESRALKRFSSDDRHQLYEKATKEKPIITAQTPLSSEEVNNQLFGRSVGYHHGIMMQCFMPQERYTDDIWQAAHGHARLGIQRGLITNPKNGELVKASMPYGSKARLIIPYINGYAIQRKSRVVDLGDSLRRFLANLGLSIGGTTGKAIVEQINAVAAATFTLGFWNGERADTAWPRIAESMSFWVERDPDQGLLWEQEMVLSTNYMAALEDHRVPVDMGHLVALGTARAQDMYSWFSYRLPRLKQPLHMRYDTLQEVFGQGIKDPYKFRQAFRNDLKSIHAVHDGFRIETPARKDYVKLMPSRSPIPARTTRLITK